MLNLFQDEEQKTPGWEYVSLSQNKEDSKQGITINKSKTNILCLAVVVKARSRWKTPERAMWPKVLAGICNCQFKHYCDAPNQGQSSEIFTANNQFQDSKKLSQPKCSKHFWIQAKVQNSAYTWWLIRTQWKKTSIYFWKYKPQWETIIHSGIPH